MQSKVGRLIVALLVVGFVAGQMRDGDAPSTGELKARDGSSAAGRLLGVTLLLLAVPLLWWNERRAVTSARVAAEGRSLVREASKTAGGRRRLVHVTGECAAAAPACDELFGVRPERALRLRRVVEMYQWCEKSTSTSHKRSDGGKETTTILSYEKKWSRERINSERFKVARDKHQNPDAFLFPSLVFAAEQTRLAGRYTLSDALVDKLEQFVPYAPLSLDGIRDHEIREMCQLGPDACCFYFGRLPQSPAIGDVRVSFELVEPCTVSVVAEQVAGDVLRPYRCQHAGGAEIALLSIGEHSAADMFASVDKNSALLTWLIRLLGWLLVVIGLNLLGDHVAVLADLLAPVAHSAEATWLIASVIALAVLLVAWLSFKPFISFSILIIIFITLYLY